MTTRAPESDLPRQEEPPSPKISEGRPGFLRSREPPPATEPPPFRLGDIQRAERAMVLVRWAAVAFAVVQVLAYRTETYPPGIKGTALAVAAFLAVANVVIWLLSRRTRDLRRARALAVGALTLDIVVASAFVWLYAFDAVSALFAILLILPLEGAIRFGLAGALVTWGAVTVLYVGRESYASAVYGDPFEPESVSFRMGIALLVALVAGLMAQNLHRQRRRLTDALAELARIDALRSGMVATLAHDVRNPLTTIRGTFKTLARHRDRLDPETLQELLGTADRQAERLERLAADLLDLARTERGRLVLHMQDVPLRQIVDHALSFVDGHRFDVDIGDGLVVRADPQRLEQIVVNLAANALRYGDAPLRVEGAREGPVVRLAFIDHGPGIPEDDIELLFEPFRAESDRGSVGLGLAIVRALTEAQGGSVDYEANVPRGARFAVTLSSG